ncbi:FAD-dependent pyridine nucleotide-disulphide oxidoreductase [Pseudarthrobacter chlorophenolicus A6]|uniref:FAD-dependent pyridine nucleotide-disulphide oxidoreductase n=1 Tax=Pseudarthrobacter chlorophenolicus (strain ATCC 700700 / DSM 12829 / CIP 107037 / JCM 12360 / KCTC 9906 / NCIMB 13794 / A6) TaxID=452863 RepID=B8HFF4_PSECP|nr:FAD-dependent oxidoreductase [Pseudarthrobacter chlorophenolicus]ACL39293.1 FAD-dependent pyridine nucleotide-disulphide oxidoreductase [Pseudarthrobacter chlorophenolicus A6]SDR01584.1 Pyridine nucleotide-disulphide oxidoreductase [Pseudarthrobacter chlorophenolicus]
MSAPAPTTSTSFATRIVIAGAGPAARALVRQLDQGRFAGSITVLSNRDDAPEDLLELALLPQVSVRFGQPASHIDADNRTVATADGMEFAYDQLVIATGSAPVAAPVEGAAQCLSYSTIDDATRIADRVQEVTRELGRRPLGILVGTGAAAGQAEAVLRAKGVRPVRTTARPAAVVPGTSTFGLSASAVVFEDGSSMSGDLVVLAEDRVSCDGLAASAGLRTAATGGVVITQDFRTSVPGIWAIGDAAAFDGVRLGLLVAAASAAGACATQLLTAASAAAHSPEAAAGAAAAAPFPARSLQAAA